MLHVQKQLPDDETVCSKQVEDSIIETNEGNKVCILLISFIYICMYVYTVIPRLTSDPANEFLG